MSPTTNSDQLHGTLDMLVLKVLEGGPLHGYAIAVHLERMSKDVLSVEEGSLYPALYRMERRGRLRCAGLATSR
jgi:PadR family transcriptional regulator PadR